MCVIGELRVERGADVHRGSQLGSRKGRTVLAVLALAAERGADADRLAEASWPEGTPDQARSVVASLISRLRRALGAEVITCLAIARSLGNSRRDCNAVATAAGRLASIDGTRTQEDTQIAIDESKLTEMPGRFVGDLGATIAAGNVVVGHHLGLYRALPRARRRRPTWRPVSP